MNFLKLSFFLEPHQKGEYMQGWRGVLVGLVVSGAVLVSEGQAQTHVDGYFRRDGTYVQPHMRSAPDRNPSNNWSYPGNTNPYTGERTTGRPDTYLDNYRQTQPTFSQPWRRSFR
jgi:hypothetical protein